MRSTTAADRQASNASKAVGQSWVEIVILNAAEEIFPEHSRRGVSDRILVAGVTSWPWMLVRAMRCFRSATVESYSMCTRTGS